MEILPGIHRIDGLQGVNSYLIEHGGELVLVDTGMPGNLETLLAYIRKIGRMPGDVGEIIITHADLDHAGNVALLHERTGAKVAAHTEEAAVMIGERPGKKMKGFVGVLAGWFIRFFPALPAVTHTFLKDGDAIRGFRVLHTPGHTRGSICLYRPGEVLISGDTILCDGSGMPRPPSPARSDDIDAARESVRRISELEFSALLPGHGNPCVAEASRKVREMFANWKA